MKKQELVQKISYIGLITLFSVISFGCGSESKADGESEGIANQPSEAWWQNVETRSELSITEEQLEEIKESWRDDARLQEEILKSERKWTRRFLMILKNDPVDEELLEKVRLKLDEVAQARFNQRVDTVVKLREILNHEQWMLLWEIAPRAIQIGRIRPTMPVTITITDGTPVPQTGTDPEIPETK